ncbi:hypothetical protein NliqN6_4521 [Naganishia liquefaciens]|uniref:Uncharacterized protein n=1 Tax=Naganishia liquefaciens TaxID=104408 RepID=A0A8H3YFY6_9TREE|nr:hypothetical protein NliqN6_4521 [Naganishia liquefaciens]
MPPVRKDKRPPSSSKSAKKYICTCGSSWKTEWARARHIGQFPEDSEGSKGLRGPWKCPFESCATFHNDVSATEGHLQSKHAWYPGEPGPKWVLHGLVEEQKEETDPERAIAQSPGSPMTAYMTRSRPFLSSKNQERVKDDVDVSSQLSGQPGNHSSWDPQNYQQDDASLWPTGLTRRSATLDSLARGSSFALHQEPLHHKSQTPGGTCTTAPETGQNSYTSTAASLDE